MKKNSALLYQVFSLLILFMAYSCSKEDYLTLDEQVDMVMNDLKIDVLSSMKEDNQVSLMDVSLIFKTEDAIVGEAVARCKRTYIKANFDLNKGDVLSNTEIIQRIEQSLPQIKPILQNACTELNTKLINQNKNWLERQKIVGQYLAEIIVGFSDALPHNHIKLLDKPRIRKEYSMMVASIEFRDQYEEIGNYYLATIDLLKEYTYDGPFICVYYDQNFEEGHHTEILIPVYKYFEDIPYTYKGKNLTIKTKIWEKREQLSFLHKGSTADLGNSWIFLEDWAKSKGIKFEAPSRELYWHEDHVNLENIITELQLVTIP